MNRSASHSSSFHCLSALLFAIIVGSFPGIHASAATEPSLEIPRRIMVLFGDAPSRTGRAPLQPVDSLTAAVLQAHLEWLGYELDYCDAAAHTPPAPAADVRAIIVDGSLRLGAEQEDAVVSWLMEQKQRGLPILLLGGIPVESGRATSRLLSELGIGGSGVVVHHLKDVQLVAADESVKSPEAEMKPRSTAFMDLRAPLDGKALVSLEGVDASNGHHRFDAAFTAPWGMAWMSPYVVLEVGANRRFFYLDPFRMIERWIGDAAFPVPDTTTQMGRRIFFSHIDGDGFASRSKTGGGKTCAEVMRDRVLKAHDLPVTVSVIEAEVRGLTQSLSPADQPHYEEIARSIFALPGVSAASHSYSHPFQWDPSDPNPGRYEAGSLKLNDDADYKTVSIEREVRGSVDYINHTLLPAGKKVEMMLWSGNCRPGEEALRLAHEMGIENMNGGDTVMSRLYPSLTAVAPRVTPWGGELQINAANQNEFMYTGGMSGAFNSGFANVVDTFECTGTPRRLKPVNLYYHFYSASSWSAMRALEKALAWCETQPLHAITAPEYARIVKDARTAHVSRVSTNEWRLTSSGALRTWRLPSSIGVPDIAHSTNISGFKTEGEVTYVHTNGAHEAVLVVAPQGQPVLSHLHIRESGVPLVFTNHQARRASFVVGGSRSGEIMFAGIPPGASCQLTRTDTPDAKPAIYVADMGGCVSVKAPSGMEAEFLIAKDVAVVRE